MKKCKKLKKLKARVKELEADKVFYQEAINTLVNNPNGMASQMIKYQVKLNKAIDGQLLMGSSEPKSISISNL